MTTVELYLDLLSQPCRAVYLFAKKTNIPFHFRLVDLMKGEQLNAKFTKVNLLQKVPALKDGDFTLAESVAILLYLICKFKIPDHWYPREPQKRAQVDEFLAWQHSTIRRHTSQLFWLKVMTPLFVGQQVPPEKMEAASLEMSTTLQQLEKKFLQDKPFIVGEEISLADLVAFTELIQPVESGVDIFANRPKLLAWRERVEASLGKELVKEAHETLHKMKTLKTQNMDPQVVEYMKSKALSISSGRF
ncbi:glutathione S-transferase theta-1 [Microcaecilia unicolor]|uniref:glutathione transferase n=1 Tax=Microcaecilia unicolor TaxID=1415580 RepID=A0A6P7ZFF2_9AMPH|nr:glutathione S-transferase theta-1-like [Microcaecilia unicolor]